jgi:predicted AAA+ superfamily ATPase
MKHNIARALDIRRELSKKSCFLFGPRQTGKTWLIRHALKDIRTYNLLDHDTFLRLSRSASILREECTPQDSLVVIDEVQKLPYLLDQVHMLMEERGMNFLLTGSSARKLRHGLWTAYRSCLGGCSWSSCGAGASPEPASRGCAGKISQLCCGLVRIII